MNYDAKVRIFAGAVNAYPTSPLRGCIADSQAIVRLFEQHGHWPAGQARFQFNDNMKNADVKEALDWIVGGPGVERTLMVLSGHGARRKRGDVYAPDDTEEFYCPYDVNDVWTSDGLANDAYFERKFAQAAAGTKNIYFAFCCHSGGVANATLNDAARKNLVGPVDAVVPKYLFGPWDDEAPAPAPTPRAFRRAEDNVFVDDDCSYVWFSAARSDQYSYEVTVDGKVFDVSREGLERAVAAKPNASIREIHKLTVDWIAEKYGFDQTPQLWGPSRLLDSDLFS